MRLALWVGLGGFLGSVGRYTTSLAFGGSVVGTWTVNVVGSFLIGAALGVGQPRLGAPLYAFLVPGFLGGFTTYSAFAGESLGFLQRGELSGFALHLVLTTLGGLGAAACGFAAAKWGLTLT